ncbi:hypothetical protein RchiOBHm_Chr0c39g0503141 [Rosa chinensis]|uniref:Uncharacterized protein n=1 Tax=Rosa chinensis TaxID=74649 RepID=A0A2P6SQ59_ROSCH|nr:hypothetical protein RchiOBHm_Chr0c39g0503141 [Rosa chinensis]
MRSFFFFFALAATAEIRLLLHQSHMYLSNCIPDFPPKKLGLVYV